MIGITTAVKDHLLDTGGQIAKFNKRFGSFGLKK